MINFQGVKKAVLPKIRPNGKIEAKKVIYETTQDVFEKKQTVVEVAKDFRKRIVNPFKDWSEGLPAYGEDGYEVLRQTMASYTSYIQKLNSSDAEKFTKLAIGENQLKALEAASNKNVDIKLFKETLEQRLGKSILSVIKPN